MNLTPVAAAVAVVLAVAMQHYKIGNKLEFLVVYIKLYFFVSTSMMNMEVHVLYLM